MGVLTVICILLKGCLGDIMTLLQFLGFSFVSSILKLAWCFYNKEQKEATLQMIEEEIFKLYLENEYGELDELGREVQVLYLWLLKH